MQTPAVMMARRKPKSSLARRLHRSVGAGAAIFVLFMVISGIAINHSNDLGLDQKPVSQTLLLNWYGLHGPQEIHSFTAGNHWLSFAGSQLYLNGSPVTTISDGVGAIASGDWLIAAGSKELLLLNTEGKLVERIAWRQAGAADINMIGLMPNGRIVVKSMQQSWSSDFDLLNWRQLDASAEQPDWSSSTLAPETIQQAIGQHYRGDNLSLERLLLDAHSGRIFGTIGILVYDLLALAVGFLALSGMLLWLRGKRNGKRK